MIALLPTWPFDTANFRPNAGDMFVVGVSNAEERFSVPVEWFDALVDAGATLVRILESDGENVQMQIADAAAKTVSLFDLQSLGAPFSEASTVWVDMTALPHEVWASLLRAFKLLPARLKFMYSEPASYAPATGITAGLKYALSSAIGDIAPLPGFAKLRSFEPAEAVFIPLLGFEGNRLAHARDSVEALVDQTFPIVGLPGFEPDYPFLSLGDNYRALKDAPIPSRIHFARAHCPFDAFLAIRQVHIDSGLPNAQVAPLGTKPHALGAVLYAIVHHESTELVYDHPRRASNRSKGRGKTWEYDVTGFLESLGDE